ncbi:MAG: DUF2804 domain-containing protein [Desulfobacterales bacterium]|nr:DUF2804 domain-containing protein [Desulfobacterales bacterium]
MANLVNEDGSIPFGIYDHPIERVNFEEFLLKNSRGKPVSKFKKKLLFKQFIFVGIVGEELLAGLAVVNLKYLANGFFYVFNRKTGALVETKKLALPFSNVFIEPRPDKMRGRFKSGKLLIDIDNDRVSARGEKTSLDVKLELDHTNPLRICTRTNRQGWNFTQKTSPVRLTGEIVSEGRRFDVSSPSYMAMVDWTGGFMRRNTFWNWASSACTLEDGRPFGLNLSCGVNETSFTENAFWLDGERTKVDTVNFVFNEEDIHEKWHITSADKKIDLVFTPESHREEDVNAGLVISKFVQLIGTFEGEARTNDGERISIKHRPGYVEDHYAKW